MIPRFAAIGGAEDSIADGGTLAVVCLAGADVDDVGIGGRDGDVADGLVGQIVELRFPVIAAVGGLPESAGGEADVDEHGVLVGAGNVVYAAHHRGGTEGAELQSAQEGVGGGIR